MKNQIITIEEFRTIWNEEYNETTMTHMVYNSNDISIIAQSEEKANQIAEWMTKEHSSQYTVKEMSEDKLGLLPDRYKEYDGLLPYYLQLGLMNELQDALEKTKKLENTLREVRDLVQDESK